MSGELKVIATVDTTEAMLISSSIPENDYAAWNSGTAYSIGDHVIVTTGELGAGYHSVYVALQANTNKHPVTDTSSPPNWELVSATNRWKMFDAPSSTQTSSAGSITVTIAPGTPCDSLALLNVQGTTADVTVTDGAGGPTIYSNTGISLDGSIVTDWLDYFYEDFAPRSELALTDLPLYGSARITVTINGTNTRLGGLVFGKCKTLGKLQMGVSVGIKDYSVKDEDAFGNTTFVERPYAKKMSGTLVVMNTDLAKVHGVMARLRARPSVWIGSQSQNYTPLIVYGWYGEFSASVNYASHSLFPIDIKGLT